MIMVYFRVVESVPLVDFRTSIRSLFLQGEGGASRADHPVGQLLQVQYNAENLAINFTKGHRGNCRVLTFDIPFSTKMKFPQSLVLQKETIQIAHRGGLPRDQRWVFGTWEFHGISSSQWTFIFSEGLKPPTR